MLLKHYNEEFLKTMEKNTKNNRKYSKPNKQTDPNKGNNNKTNEGPITRSKTREINK
jgi:hypothetical protein